MTAITLTEAEVHMLASACGYAVEKFAECKKTMDEYPPWAEISAQFEKQIEEAKALQRKVIYADRIVMESEEADPLIGKRFKLLKPDMNCVERDLPNGGTEEVEVVVPVGHLCTIGTLDSGLYDVIFDDNEQGQCMGWCRYYPEEIATHLEPI